MSSDNNRLNKADLAGKANAKGDDNSSIAAAMGRKAAKAARKGGALDGDLALVQMPTLLQSVLMAKMTGCLEVKRGQEQAEIFFVNGVLSHARSRSSTVGEEALYELLPWKTGDFHFEAEKRADENSIKQPLDSLLLQGMQLIDNEEYLTSAGFGQGSIITMKDPSLSERHFEATLKKGAPLDLTVQKSFYRRINGVRTAEEISAKLGLTRSRWVPILCNLLRCDLVTITAGDSAINVIAMNPEQEPMAFKPDLKPFAAEKGRGITIAKHKKLYLDGESKRKHLIKVGSFVLGFLLMFVLSKVYQSVFERPKVDSADSTKAVNTNGNSQATPTNSDKENSEQYQKINVGSDWANKKYTQPRNIEVPLKKSEVSAPKTVSILPVKITPKKSAAVESVHAAATTVKPNTVATKLPYSSQDSEAALPPPDKPTDTSQVASQVGKTQVANSGASTSVTEESDYQKGRQYLRDKNFFEAEQCFRQILDSSVKGSGMYQSALSGMVSVCMQEHRYPDARNYAVEYSKYVKAGTMAAAANHRQIADAAWVLKDYDVAERELLLARDIYKIRNESYSLCLLNRHLATLKRTQKDYAGALSFYKDEAAYRQEKGDTKLIDRVQADIGVCESELKKSTKVTDETLHD